MSVQINGTNGLTFNDGSSQNTSPFVGGFCLRNRIINGAMMIDQRNAGASVTSIGIQYTIDRWRELANPTGKFTIQRNAGSVTPPNGFVNYMGLTSTSAYTIGAAEYCLMQQFIEGYNVADLAWGTASAAAVTVSFWVRSSLTGTFGGSLQNSAQTRSYPFVYTISSANTWEYKSVTIAGDTSGTWLTDSGRGIGIQFSIGAGSSISAAAGSWAAGDYRSATGATSVVGTNGATFYITGVQLEKGSTATSFDYRPYGTELALCQRYTPVYYIEQGNLVAFVGGANNCAVCFPVPTQPRVVPTGCTLVGTWNTNTSARQDIITSSSFQAYGGGFYVNVNIAAGVLTANNAITISANAGSKAIFNGCEL